MLFVFYPYNNILQVLHTQSFLKWCIKIKSTGSLLICVGQNSNNILNPEAYYTSNEKTNYTKFSKKLHKSTFYFLHTNCQWSTNMWWIQTQIYTRCHQVETVYICCTLREPVKSQGHSRRKGKGIHSQSSGPLQCSAELCCLSLASLVVCITWLCCIA